MRGRLKDLQPQYDKSRGKASDQRTAKERVFKEMFEAMERQAYRLRHERGQSSLLSVLQAQVEVQISPDALDTDPFLFNVENGTIDLRTGAMREQRQSDFISRLADVCYDPQARSELWDQFIKDIAQGDEQYMAYLQMALGMSLTGDTSEKALFFLHGPTNTDKSTLLAAFGRMLADYACNISFETLLKKPTAGGNVARSDLARLEGARFVYASEVGKGRRFDVATIKMLAGYSDPITVRDLYASERTFQPALKLWLAANDRPEIDQDDDASWERLHVLPFMKQWKAQEQDRDLFEKLNSPAVRSAMLTWAVQGCLKWLQARPLKKPRTVLVAHTLYKQAMDPLQPLLRRMLQIRAEPGD
jgi:putative DNA primase/helicase